MKVYENLSLTITNKINNKLKKLNDLKNITTEKERQYVFLKFLQTLAITEKQVFDIYTNTSIENE